MKKEQPIQGRTLDATAQWIHPQSLQVERYADIICQDPDQIVSRPLAAGYMTPEEGELIYFSSQEAECPAFTSEDDFMAYCDEHGLDEMPSAGKFSNEFYLLRGTSFAGEELVIARSASLEQVETLAAALTGPVQALIDAGIVHVTQAKDPSPEA